MKQNSLTLHRCSKCSTLAKPNKFLNETVQRHGHCAFQTFKLALDWQEFQFLGVARNIQENRHVMTMAWFLWWWQWTRLFYAEPYGALQVYFRCHEMVWIKISCTVKYNNESVHSILLLPPSAPHHSFISRFQFCCTCQDDDSWRWRFGNDDVDSLKCSNYLAGRYLCSDYYATTSEFAVLVCGNL